MRLPYRFLFITKKEGDYSRLIRENNIAGIACRVAASSNKANSLGRQKASFLTPLFATGDLRVILLVLNTEGGKQDAIDTCLRDSYLVLL